MIDHVFERRDLSLGFRIFPLSEPRHRLPEGATLGWGWAGSSRPLGY